VTRLTEAARAALIGHGITPGADESVAALRLRLNERYLEEVRALRERQRAGEIPITDYARHVEALRRRFPLLGVPVERWEESPEAPR
jgi:hypothetical protein